MALFDCTVIALSKIVCIEIIKNVHQNNLWHFYRKLIQLITKAFSWKMDPLHFPISPCSKLQSMGEVGGVVVLVVGDAVVVGTMSVQAISLMMWMSSRAMVSSSVNFGFLASKMSCDEGQHWIDLLSDKTCQRKWFTVCVKWSKLKWSDLVGSWRIVIHPDLVPFHI